MMRPRFPLPALALLVVIGGVLAVAGAAESQGLPIVGQPVGRVMSGVVDPVLGAVSNQGRELVGKAGTLAKARLDRLDALLRDNRAALERDDQGNPSVRGEIIGMPANAVALDAAKAEGFTVAAEETIEGLDIRTVTLRPPNGMFLARALKVLRKAAPGDWSANQLHFESGASVPLTAAVALAPQAKTTSARIGIIDSGIARHPGLTGSIEQRGFASGAPAPSAHGTAIAGLIAGGPPLKGVLPATPLIAADVYGRDPAGGNALAIARALGWMASRNVSVVTISLIGPPNPLLARVIAAAQAKGMAIVAAVGNDGPAAPPAYPASYPGVIAVTGVDGRNRALIEAGRALHLDYAAPGADMIGASANGGTMRLRGTSYAAPLVAARLAAHYDTGGRAQAIRALDRETHDLGKPGSDKIFGRGLVCGNCPMRP